MDKAVEKIADYYVAKNYIEEDKKEIYSYGFKLIFSDVINFLLVFGLGMLLGKAAESIIFLITLCGIRRFSGGYHAKTFWLCRVSMLVTFFAVIILSEVVFGITEKLIFTAVINSVSVLMIGLLAPVKHKNKKLNKKQLVQNKRRAVIMSSVMALISVWLTKMEIFHGIVISITLSAVMILMIIGLIIMKGGKKNV